jgi:hypothetical protein
MAQNHTMNEWTKHFHQPITSSLNWLQEAGFRS